MSSPQDGQGPEGLHEGDVGLSGTPDPAYAADLATAYSELQNLLVERPDVMAFLEQVAALAATVVANSSCGITMRRDREVATVAASDSLAAQIDEIQYGRGQGPCLQALNSGEVVSVADLASDDRWGEYRMHALTFGVRSSLSMPLTVDGTTRGALNLYTTAPNSFSGETSTRANAFARQAASALSVVLQNTDQAVLQRQTQEALVSRTIIDQAMGIIMGQQRINSTAAFAVLREASQARNRRLSAIAAELIEAVTGHPPSSPHPFVDGR